MKKILSAINFVVDGLKALVEGVLTLVESLGAMLKWIPELLNFATGAFLNYIPVAFLSLVAVLIAIYVIKLTLGGDNK